MPIIEFSQRDILRGKLLTPGVWYRVKIESIGEKPSKDKGSTNYNVEGTVIHDDKGDAAFANVPLDWNFNSKAIGFAVGFLQAFGVEVEPGKRFDLASAVGKELDVFVENDLYDGRMVNRVNHKYRAFREVT